jgi:hypothetical protein
MHNGSHREPQRQRGPFWTPITPPTGSFFHAETQFGLHRGRLTSVPLSVIPAPLWDSRFTSVVVGMSVVGGTFHVKFTRASVPMPGLIIHPIEGYSLRDFHSFTT